MSETPKRETTAKDQVDLRLPAGLRAQVQKQAQLDNRSMNAQIVHYVETGLKGIDNATLAEAVLEIRTAMKALEERLDGPTD